ncbi:helicase-related protein, partial [Kitasatospora purpeofusca]|uniref:helicase-related protein n=1 Tax=Kitasatospora purpeofusca TaxID=67352 RepID=UPI00244664C1
ADMGFLPQVTELLEQVAEGCQTMLANGVKAAALHGGKSQPQRNRTLEQFRNGQVTALIATNVAARGITRVSAGDEELARITGARVPTGIPTVIEAPVVERPRRGTSTSRNRRSRPARPVGGAGSGGGTGAGSAGRRRAPRRATASA